MTLTVGRCVLPDPSNVDASGDFLSLSGFFYSTATTAANRAAEAQARSAQLMGMVDNPDEDVFPLVWSSESMYDGFYAVEDASWSWLNDGSSRAAVAAWSLTLRRTRSQHVASLSGVAAGSYRGTFPGSVTNVPVTIQSGATDSVDSFTGPDGFVVVRGEATMATSSYSDSWTADVTVEGYYVGAVRLEALAADSEWYDVVGTVFPRGSTQWRLSNGRVRFTCDLSTGVIAPAIYDVTPGEWQDCAPITGNSFVIGEAASPIGNRATDEPPAIIRNDGSGVVLKAASHNLYLRPGVDFLEISYYSTTVKRGLRFNSSTAATALPTANSGVYQSAADANGNYVTIGSTPIMTNNVTNGRMYTTSAPTAAFSMYIGVLSSIGGSALAQQLSNFRYAMSLTRRVVAP